jgi:hypothetical protein
MAVWMALQRLSEYPEERALAHHLGRNRVEKNLTVEMR